MLALRRARDPRAPRNLGQRLAQECRINQLPSCGAAKTGLTDGGSGEHCIGVDEPRLLGETNALTQTAFDLTVMDNCYSGPVTSAGDHEAAPEKYRQYSWRGIKLFPQQCVH